MIRFFTFAIAVALFVACSKEEKTSASTGLPLQGTWQLIKATSERNDSIVRTDPPGTRMIKIINEDHFAFLNHDVKAEGDTSKTAKLFVAGGGTYTLADNKYTEHLDYCSARDYEGHVFEFTIEIKGDTLIQTGIEKLKDFGIGEQNVQLQETYRRVRK
jgi:hypothetical protein